MKKIITSLCCLLATTPLFLACNEDETPTSSNYQDILTQDNVSVVPNTLQIVDNKTIPVSFTVNVPARFLPRKALLTLCPVLVCGDKTYRGTAKTWQGDLVTGGNEVIPYDQPSQLQLLAEFAYEKSMTTYILYLEVAVIENTRPSSFRIRTNEGLLEQKL